jgi:3-hydroxyacyl-CoA dehydrogenase
MNKPVHLTRAAGVDQCAVKRAAVIGAGSMGAGIAAQFANAGVPVDLLDIAGEGAATRNGPAEAGIERQLKVNGFMHPAAAGLVRAGNVEDHLDRLAEADWIVEAVIEKLEVKRNLYRKLEAARKPGSIVSSNTSTIPRADLIDGMGDAFAADFLITHFFNPPRLMRLVEIVSAPGNDEDLIARAKTAAETILGKTVVDCRDTPGFIANRIGCYWLAVAVIEAKRLGLTVEEADAAMSALGIPKTGVFGLLDLIGLDLVPHVWGSLLKALPEEDDLHSYDLPADPLIRRLIAEGRFGRKAKAGFYRMAADKSREVVDLDRGEYRGEQPVKPSELPGSGRDLAALLDADDRLGRYAWRVLSRTILYSATHAPEIAGDIRAIDTAIELGYAWKIGPFSLADRYGTRRIVSRLRAEGCAVPPVLAAAEDGGFYDASGRARGAEGTAASSRPETFLQSLTVAKSRRPRLLGNDAASLWDLGDGIGCFEIHTKMNSLTPAVFDALEETLRRGGEDFRGLVIGNDDPRAFSVGADLAFFVDLIRREQWRELETYIDRGQDLFLLMKYAPFPVVAAAHGLALGGGCEFMLHAHAVVAHAELNAGLPETKVGIVPGWGGCTQLILRAQQVSASAATVFKTIMAGAISGSAAQAQDLGLLRETDEIAMNRDHLLRIARERAVALADAGYEAPERALLVPAGLSEKRDLMAGVHAQKDAGQISETDCLIADKLAGILTGGAGSDPARPLREEHVMRLERDTVMELVKSRATRDRIEHMLAFGKPLRN